MNPVAGLNLEYFVIGAVASLWLTPALSILNLVMIPPSSSDSSTGVINATLIPAIYVAGMVSDLIGYLVTKNLKANLEQESWLKVKESWVKMKEGEVNEKKFGKAEMNEKKSGWKRLKELWRKATRSPSSEDKEKPCSAQLVHAYASCYERELAEGIEMRSTRDRIARGSMIACVPLLIAVPIKVGIEWVFVPILIVVALFSLWYRFQKLSASYDAYAWHVMNERHGLNKIEVAQ